MAMIGGTNEAENENDFGGVSAGGFSGPGEIGGALTGDNVGAGGFSPAGLEGYGGGNRSIGDYLGGLMEQASGFLGRPFEGFDWGNAAKWGLTGLGAGNAVAPGLGSIVGLFSGVAGGAFGKNRGNEPRTAVSDSIANSTRGTPGSQEDRDPFGPIFNEDSIQSLMGGSGGGTSGDTAATGGREQTDRGFNPQLSPEAPGSIRKYLRSEDDDLAESLVFGKDEFTKKLF